MIRHLHPMASLVEVILVACASFGCHSAQNRFYPIGIYSVPADDLKAAREAGFNLVTGPANKAFLDAADVLSLKVLASLGTGAGTNFNASVARRAISSFDSHPALWAWYLVDEPDMQGIEPNLVRSANRTVKNLPGIKPTALVIYDGYSALHYGNITDMMMIDRYPIPWLPLANFPQHVRMTRLALGPNKPLVAVIQAFDWTYDPELWPEKVNFRPPTFAELRCMTYSALAERVNGLFYFAFHSGQWKITEHAEVWESLKEVVSEVRVRLPLFQAEHIWWPYVHQFRDRTIEYDATLQNCITPALLRVKNGTEFVRPGDYILTVNSTEKTHSYRVCLPRSLVGTLPVFAENRTLPIKDNWIEDEFGPYAIHIYGPLHEPTSTPSVFRRNH